MPSVFPPHRRFQQDLAERIGFFLRAQQITSGGSDQIDPLMDERDGLESARLWDL